MTVGVSNQARKVYVERIRGESNQAVYFHQLYYVAPVLAVIGQEALPQHAMSLEPANLGSSAGDRRPLNHYIPRFCLANTSQWLRSPPPPSRATRLATRGRAAARTKDLEKLNEWALGQPRLITI
jgi:hypothetical protein